MSTELLFSPLIDREISDREVQAAARLARDLMFDKHAVPNPELSMSRGPEADRLRAVRRAGQEREYLTLLAADHQRMFSGVCADFADTYLRAAVA